MVSIGSSKGLRLLLLVFCDACVNASIFASYAGTCGRRTQSCVSVSVSLLVLQACTANTHRQGHPLDEGLVTHTSLMIFSPLTHHVHFRRSMARSPRRSHLQLIHAQKASPFMLSLSPSPLPIDHSRFLLEGGLLLVYL